MVCGLRCAAGLVWWIYCGYGFRVARLVFGFVILGDWLRLLIVLLVLLACRYKAVFADCGYLVFGYVCYLCFTFDLRFVLICLL